MMLRSPVRRAEPAEERTARVAIVIPCYRVARHIERVVASIPPEYEPIVCVDDASDDGTAEVIRALDDPRVVLVRNADNRGVGGAMKAGYVEALACGADIIVKMDGDGQMSAEDLPQLVAPLLDDRADYAKGNRFVDRAALRQMPRARLLGNAVLTFASKLACGYWNMLDVTNGYTAITSHELRRVNFARLAERYFFETSMLIELNILRARVADVEMPARYGDERSSMRISRIVATFPRMLIRGASRRFYWRYLIQDFSVTSVCAILGAIMLIGGATFGAVEWARSVMSGSPATAGTVLLAGLPVMLGVQALLVALVLDVLSSPTLKIHAPVGRWPANAGIPSDEAPSYLARERQRGEHASA
jgi:glycosyltransferase involved in cell wall biosynthesis